MNEISKLKAATLCFLLAGMLGNPVWADDNARNKGDKDKSASEYKQSGMQRKDGMTTAKAWQDNDMLGWADSDDFGTGMGMSVLERRTLFPFWEQEEILSRINLTSDQRKELVESFKSTCKKVEEAKLQARTAAFSLREEMDKDDPSVSDAEKFSDRIADAMGEKQKALVSHAALVKKTLNPQQEQALRAAGRNYSEKMSGELSQLRESIGAAVMGGGGFEEAQALIDSSSLPLQVRDRLLDDVARKIESGEYLDGRYRIERTGRSSGGSGYPSSGSDSNRTTPNRTPVPTPR